MYARGNINGDPVLNPNSVCHIICHFWLYFIFHNGIDPGNSWMKISPATEDVLILACSKLWLHALTFVILRRKTQTSSVLVHGGIHQSSPNCIMTIAHNLLRVLQGNYKVLIPPYVVNG